MLRTLTIRDFVIVDALEIDFNAGFTVLSGETGAGKSILVDALALALGERADGSIVRQGCERTDICAEFEVSPAVEAALGEMDLSDNGVVLMRRTIDLNGRSKAWINGAPATLNQLRSLGEQLVDIHGQHEHQSLLRADAQRTLLDAHADLSASLADLTERWRTWQSLRRQREALEHDDKALRDERERLSWQAEEIGRVALQDGEWQDIQDEHQRLANAAELIDGAQQALDALSESDSAVLSQLAALLHRVRHLQTLDARLSGALEALEPAQINLQEALHALNDYLSRLEIDPQRLIEVEHRIEVIHSTARKFRVLPQELPATLAKAQQRLSELAATDDPEALLAAEQKAHEDYLRDAKALSALRAKAASTMAKAVTEAMQSLSMPGGAFAVALVPREPSAHGLENIEFQVAAHPGVPLRALAKVASGGELARISLAIAVIASGASTVATLIFDEVDSGIGGAVAEVVGRLLRQLGRSRQVLSVTHLPQVAAQADTHLGVSKAQQAGTTVSRIETLQGPARTDEIARMLGGIDITATTRKHARELLAQAS